MDWQPIETAPRDGSDVLIGGYYPNGVWFVSMGWFSEDRGYWSGHKIDPPTHWMPLPQPPQSLS